MYRLPLCIVCYSLPPPPYQLEALLTKHSVPLALVSGQKVVELAEDEPSTISTEKLLACLNNQSGERLRGMAFRARVVPLSSTDSEREAISQSLC